MALFGSSFIVKVKEKQNLSENVSDFLDIVLIVIILVLSVEGVGFSKRQIYPAESSFN